MCGSTVGKDDFSGLKCCYIMSLKVCFCSREASSVKNSTRYLFDVYMVFVREQNVTAML